MEPKLYWTARGEGAPLVMLQGGDGDADASNAIAERVSGFRVISYDRRGLSRSALPPTAQVSLPMHTDDAAEVISLAGGGPVLVFGTSIGAMIGLDLLARYPHLVKKLIAHEPPATELLPAEVRDGVERGRDDVEALYAKSGVLPAMRKFLSGTGVDFTDRESDVGLPAPNPGRLLNLKFFLEHDVPAVRRFRVALPVLREQTEKIIVAAGESSRGLWIHRCAAELAAALSVPLALFPGGHAGYQSHPRGFARRISELLG